MREKIDCHPKSANRSIAERSSGQFPAALLLVLLLLPLLTACAKDGPNEEPRDVVAAATQPATGVQEVATVSSISTDPGATVAPAATATPGPPPAPLAAVVNGQYILLADYERLVAIYESALQDEGVDLDTEEGKAEAAQIRENVLEGIVDSTLMRQEAAKMGLVLSAEEVDAQVLADIEDGGGQAAFEEWLQATGQTDADYREMLYDLMLSDLVLEVLSDALPTEADQVHVRHIAVSSEEAAQEILAQLQQGADFEELAAERSEDLWTKDDGGDLGWFCAGVVAPEMEQVAFAMDVGEVGRVVQIEDGYHVIQVLERDPEHPVSPDLKMDLELVAFEQWLEQLRATAVIERFVEQ